MEPVHPSHLAEVATALFIVGAYLLIRMLRAWNRERKLIVRERKRLDGKSRSL